MIWDSLRMWASHTWAGWVGVGVGGAGRGSPPLKVKPCVVNNEFQNSFMYCAPSPPLCSPKSNFRSPKYGASTSIVGFHVGLACKKVNYACQPNRLKMYVRKGVGELRSAKKEVKNRGFANIKQGNIGATLCNNHPLFSAVGGPAWVKGMG